MPTRHLSLLFSFLLLSATVSAQIPGHTALRGELQIEGAESAHDYQVDLADCAGGSAVVRGWMSGGNRFEFRDVEPGCKLLRVVTGPQRVVIQEVQVFVDGTDIPVVIRVAKSEKEPVKAGKVSVEQLRHPIPDKVVRALSDANRLWQAGRAAEAAGKLRPLAAKYPDIGELQLNLGIVEMKLGNVAAAAEHFSKARELQPRSPAAALDSAFALGQLNRLVEAESAAKDAVALDPGNPLARRVLAEVQAAERRAGN